ncbi:ester cyclase [Leisingera sp. XS_AS12]|uniref:ester cyclase n=1 Tax=Leisingera sp. XS_AS12 TaxID=3241294 RepID=UPI003511760E
MKESDVKKHTIIQMPLSDQNKASDIVRAFYKDVFENNNRKALPRYFSPDARFGGAIGDLADSKSEFIEAADVLMSLFEVNPTVSINIKIDGGDWVAATTIIEATSTGSELPLLIRGQLIAKVKNQKIVEWHSSTDYLSLFEQLGQIPKDSLPILTTGARLMWKGWAGGHT